jgi:hypothetical protein
MRAVANIIVAIVSLVVPFSVLSQDLKVNKFYAEDARGLPIMPMTPASDKASELISFFVQKEGYAVKFPDNLDSYVQLGEKQYVIFSGGAVLASGVYLADMAQR